MQVKPNVSGQPWTESDGKSWKKPTLKIRRASTEEEEEG